jgi:hypothetical protein
VTALSSAVRRILTQVRPIKQHHIQTFINASIQKVCLSKSSCFNIRKQNSITPPNINI